MGWLSLPWGEELNPVPPRFPTASVCGPLQGNSWELARRDSQERGRWRWELGSRRARGWSSRPFRRGRSGPGALGRMAGRRGLGLGEGEAGRQQR